MKPTIFPALRYTNAPAAMEWLVRAFGFEKQADYRAPDGTVAHAELRLGAGIVGINSATPPTDANPWSHVRQGVYVLVDDVDAHCERASANGARIAIPLRDTDYGAREYSAFDVDGHLWGFGTYDMGAKEGEPNIFPELQYRRASAAPAWLGRTFGFKTTEEVAGPDGGPMHVEMRLGDATIMLNFGEGADRSGELTQATSIRIDDPDAHFARASKEGAVVVQSPMTTHYGARSYWVRDLEDFLWGFSTYRPK